MTGQNLSRKTIKGATMKNLFALLVTTCSLAVVSGCSTPSTIYSDTISSFDKGFTTTKGIIDDRAQAMNVVSRRKVLEAQLYAGEATPADATVSNFARVVCASSTSLADQAQATDTLGLYDTELKAIGKAPEANISAIFGSIVEDLKKPDALKPAGAKTSDPQACGKEVANLVKLPQQQVPEVAFLAAAGAVVAAGTALYDAISKIVVDVGTAADDELRGRKLATYVKASQPVVTDALKKLNAGDPTTDQYCQTINYDPPCHKTTATNLITKLDAVTIAEKWAALREPWHLYLAMSDTKAAYNAAVKRQTEFGCGGKPCGDGAAAPTDLALLWYRLDKQQDDLNAALQDYATLATAASVSDIGKSMSNANDTLVQLADGKITPQQAWTVLQNWYNAAQKASSDYKGLSTAAQGFSKAVGNLP